MWHGSPLSVYEELSLLSFIRCGHEVELYAYAPLDAPPGVRLCEANAVVPEKEVFEYATGPAKGSYAAFSNLFRFKLLFEKGGIWADLDILCLRPLDDLPEACVGRISLGCLNQGIVKFPAGHSIPKALSEKLEALGPRLYLGQTSELFSSAVAAHRGDCEVLPPGVFYPLDWEETWRLVDPAQGEYCRSRVREARCLHWWNTAITLGIGLPKDRLPPQGSYLYDKAVEIFQRTELKAWPAESVKTWVQNFKTAQACRAQEHLARRPVTTLLKSDMKTVLRDLAELARAAKRKIFG
jgi:hypothetical protein